MDSSDLSSSEIKFMFVLQLPEDNTKNYIGILDKNYNYSSFNFFIKSKVITVQLMKKLKKVIFGLNITKNTKIVLSNTIAESHPLYLFLSIIRVFMKFDLNSVSIAKTFKRISAFHISYRLNREFRQQDYNKIYKKMLKDECCMWINKEEDMKLQNLPKRDYRIQRFLRICMYYMCIKYYYLAIVSKSTKK